MKQAVRARGFPSRWHHRGGLVLYLLAVVLVTSVHDLRLLAGALLGLAMLAGRDFPMIARRAALAMLLFNGVISASYIIVGLLKDHVSVTFLVRINLRVFLLTSMSFLVVRRLDLIHALGFSRTLLHVVLLTHSQVMTFRRLLQDFGLALRSRSLAKPSLRDHYRQRAATASFFLQKSLRDATEITEALTSRGFFIDQD